MSAISDILGQIPLGELASQVGASQKDTKSAATQVIQSLLGGMSANVADGGGDDLTAAIKQHAVASTPKTTKKTTTSTAPATKTTKTKKTALSDVDTADGSKIVEHVLGTTPSKAAAAVSEKTGTDQSLLSKLMPILAPIVMAYLASKLTKGSAGGTAVGAGLGGILGGILGGGNSQPATQQQSSSGGIGDLLGGILGQSLGSGNSASSSGGLGNLLSNLF